MSTQLEALLTTDIQSQPSAIVLVGPPGIGKTSLVANIPGVLLVTLKRERSLGLLKRSGAVPLDVATNKKPIDKFMELVTLVQMLASESSAHDYKALAIDSLTPLEGLLSEHIVENKFEGNQAKFDSYGAGFKHMVATWRKFLDLLDQLRDLRGMSIIFTGHHATKLQSDAEGDDYDRNTVAFDKRLWEQTYPWADAVLFARYRTVKEDNKIIGGAERLLVTGGIAACDAKNRYGLDKTISMGAGGAEAWDNLRTAISTALGG